MTLALNKTDRYSDQQRRDNFERLCVIVKHGGWSAIKMEPVSVREGVSVSLFEHDEWDWSHYALSAAALSKGKRSSGIVSFKKFSQESLRNEIKLLAYGWMFYVSGRFGKEVDVASIGFRCDTILNIIHKFLVSDGKNSLSALSEVNTWAAFTRFMKSLNTSHSTCIQTASTLRAITPLAGCLPFYFANVASEPAKWARSVCRQGSEHSQTLAIPERIAEVVYGEAVRMIEDAYPHVDAIESALQQEMLFYAQGKQVVDRLISSGEIDVPAAPKDYFRLIWKHATKPRAKIINTTLQSTGWVPENNFDGAWFSTIQSKLIAAAYICIAGFTGMRDSEIVGVRHDSFYQTNIGGVTVDLVESIHQKLTKGGKVEAWIACPIVEKAIRVAAALSKHLREQWEAEFVRLRDLGKTHEADIASLVSGLLWLSQSSKNELPKYETSKNMGERLRRFVRDCGDAASVTKSDYENAVLINPDSENKLIEDVKIGSPWPLAKHQMRRTFAVFVVKNKLGHPIALKQQFKHIHLKMTEWYSNGASHARNKQISQDISLNKLIADVLVEQTTHIIVDAAHGGAAGGFAVAIQNDATIYGSWDSVYALVKQGRLTLHGTAHGYCKNGYQCDMDGVINPASCTSCENSIISHDKLEWWSRKHTALVQHLSTSKLSQHEKSHFITQIRAAENVMLAAGRAFTKYQAGIEVVTV